jgi:hypothetical protein
MKRFSARRVRRWIIQALARCLEQRSKPPDQSRFMEDKPEASRWQGRSGAGSLGTSQAAAGYRDL